MAKQKPVPRRASIDTMTRSLERTLRSEGKSEKTIYSYALSVRLLSEFLTQRGRALTVDVPKDDIRDFITEQSTYRKLPSGKWGGSAATAMVRFKSLQQFFRHCVEEDELESSPMTGMRAPKVNDDPVDIVSDEALSRLLRARAGKTLTDRRDTAIMRVFLDTGCRLSEVTDLKLCDIDLDGQALRVTGKGNRVREVGFGIKTYQAIDRYLRLLERERPDWVLDLDNRLWLGRQGPMRTSGITNVLHRMCADAGVERLHWHQFRHTYAHTWLDAGGNEIDLMTLAGWQSRAMLERYAKSTRVARAQAASRRMSLGDRV